MPEPIIEYGRASRIGRHEPKPEPKAKECPAKGAFSLFTEGQIKVDFREVDRLKHQYKKCSMVGAHEAKTGVVYTYVRRAGGDQ